MAKRTSRGRGRGRGRGSKVSNGKNDTVEADVDSGLERDQSGDEDDAISGELREHEKELEIDQCSVGNHSLEIDQCSLENEEELEIDHCSLENHSLPEEDDFDEPFKGMNDPTIIHNPDFQNEVLKDDPPLSVDAKQEQPVHVEWRGLFKSEKSMGSLDYIAPVSSEGKVFVSPPVAAVEEGESRWNSSLVGQFLDKAFPFFLVKKSVQLMWKQYGDVEVFSVENEMFIFRFADEATCDEVLESKLWYVANKPLILRKWTPGMQVLKLTMSSIPIWVKFMHLPLEYWTKTCLSHVASGVGKPLFADRVTEEQQRLGYARVLVEIDANSVCPKEIFICRANGTNLSIGVEYPWLPP
jgi:hypothetical protein